MSGAPEYVNENWTIQEAVEKYPVTAEVMMSYGLHCVGCHVSGFETIREGAMGHGMMDEDDVKELIQEMNEKIHALESLRSEDSVVVTPVAMSKIIQFAKEEEKEDYFLRITAKKNGCCDITYSLDFDNNPLPDDHVFSDGFEIRIDPESFSLLKGSVIDFVSDYRGEGFKINNPSTKDCGCSLN